MTSPRRQRSKSKNGRGVRKSGPLVKSGLRKGLRHYYKSKSSERRANKIRRSRSCWCVVRCSRSCRRVVRRKSRSCRRVVRRNSRSCPRRKSRSCPNPYVVAIRRLEYKIQRLHARLYDLERLENIDESTVALAISKLHSRIVRNEAKLQNRTKPYESSAKTVDIKHASTKSSQKTIDTQAPPPKDIKDFLSKIKQANEGKEEKEEKESVNFQPQIRARSASPPPYSPLKSRSPKDTLHSDMLERLYQLTKFVSRNTPPPRQDLIEDAKFEGYRGQKQRY